MYIGIARVYPSSYAKRAQCKIAGTSMLITRTQYITSTSTNNVLGSTRVYSHSSYLQARDKRCEVMCILSWLKTSVYTGTTP